MASITQMLKLCNLRSGSSNKQHQQYLQAAKHSASQLYFAGHHQLRALPLIQVGTSSAASDAHISSAAAAASSAAATANAFGSQTASQSLFNKLDSFVHQLQTSRSFFATWPERLCHKMRQPQTTQLDQSQKQSSVQRAAANETTQEQQTGACWNGIDFSG